MAIGKIKASRVNNVDADTYVGEDGILFYNYANGVVRISDGVTPGGVSVPYTVASNTTIGGIKAGPGANVGLDGTLTIDTSGLPLSIGNLLIANTTISTLQPDVDLNLAANGEGQINLVGNVHIHTTSGGLESDPIVDINEEGRVAIYVPSVDPNAAVKLIGTTTGTTIAPGLSGAMLHVTGQIDTDCRLYYDGNGGYVAHNSRAWNGNITSGITAILAGDDVMRFNATAATSAGMGNVAFAQMRYTALEDQTPTAQGSKITFTVTPVGQSASNRVDVADITVADGVSATKFTTAGNITGGNLSLTGNIVADYVQANNFGNVGNVEIEAGDTYWYFNTDNTFTGNGNVNVGNVSATNYTGLVTHGVRNAGSVGGTTLTLNVTSDDMVHCTFTDNFTVAFSNIIPGRIVTLIATNTSGFDSDIITAGISAVNMQGDNTLTVTQQTTAIITYYSTGTTTGDIFASAVYQ